LPERKTARKIKKFKRGTSSFLGENTKKRRKNVLILRKKRLELRRTRGEKTGNKCGSGTGLSQGLGIATLENEQRGDLSTGAERRRKKEEERTKKRWRG